MASQFETEVINWTESKIGTDNIVDIRLTGVNEKNETGDCIVKINENGEVNEYNYFYTKNNGIFEMYKLNKMEEGSLLDDRLYWENYQSDDLDEMKNKKEKLINFDYKDELEKGYTIGTITWPIHKDAQDNLTKLSAYLLSLKTDGEFVGTDMYPIKDNNLNIQYISYDDVWSAIKSISQYVGYVKNYYDELIQEIHSCPDIECLNNITWNLVLPPQS